MKKPRLSVTFALLAAMAGAVVTVELLALSARPSAGIPVAGVRGTMVSAADSSGQRINSAPAKQPPVRSDAASVESSPPQLRGNISTGESISMARSDGSIVQNFPVTLQDGSPGMREKVTRRNGRNQSVVITDRDAQGHAVAGESSVTSQSEISCSVLPRTAPVLPVAFQEAAPGSVSLTPDQAAGAEHVQDQFFNEIGGESANPASPEYARQWPQAQSLADQRLRAAIGAQAFMRWQAEAYLKAKEADGPPSSQ